MKYLLILQMTADLLTTEQRAELEAGREQFRRIAEDAGELISTHALADPATSTVISTAGIRAGSCHAAAVGGYYLVDVESKARALELADLLPDARIDGLAVEIRPVMLAAGADY